MIDRDAGQLTQRKFVPSRANPPGVESGVLRLTSCVGVKPSGLNATGCGVGSGVYVGSASGSDDDDALGDASLVVWPSSLTGTSFLLRASRRALTCAWIIG